MKKPDGKNVRLTGVAVTIPLMFIACPIVGYFLGTFLAEIWPPVAKYGAAGGLLLGFAAAALETARLLKLMIAMDKASGHNRPQRKG